MLSGVNGGPYKQIAQLREIGETNIKVEGKNAQDQKQ